MATFQSLPGEIVDLILYHALLGEREHSCIVVKPARCSENCYIVKGDAPNILMGQYTQLFLRLYIAEIAISVTSDHRQAPVGWEPRPMLDMTSTNKWIATVQRSVIEELHISFSYHLSCVTHPAAVLMALQLRQVSRAFNSRMILAAKRLVLHLKAISSASYSGEGSVEKTQLQDQVTGIQRMLGVLENSPLNSVALDLEILSIEDLENKKDKKRKRNDEDGDAEQKRIKMVA